MVQRKFTMLVCELPKCFGKAKYAMMRKEQTKKKNIVNPIKT